MQQNKWRYSKSVEQTVTGLGYDLVEIERSAGGLLRITIDWLWEPGVAEEQFITVEDCEKVTRQLQFALEVEGAEYGGWRCHPRGSIARCGMKRICSVLPGPWWTSPSRRRLARNWERRLAGRSAPTARSFAARWSELIPAVSQGGKSSGAMSLQIKPGQRVSRKRVPAPLQALGFTLDEVREVRLAPMVDFKGRRPVDAPQAD